MTQAYEAVFDQLAGRFKYVDIAAFPPGSTIDDVGVEFPFYNTSIGSNEVVPGESPSSYWQVHSWLLGAPSSEGAADHPPCTDLCCPSVALVIPAPGRDTAGDGAGEDSSG